MAPYVFMQGFIDVIRAWSWGSTSSNVFHKIFWWLLEGQTRCAMVSLTISIISSKVAHLNMSDHNYASSSWRVCSGLSFEQPNTLFGVELGPGANSAGFTGAHFCKPSLGDVDLEAILYRWLFLILSEVHMCILMDWFGFSFKLLNTVIRVDLGPWAHSACPQGGGNTCTCGCRFGPWGPTLSVNMMNAS